jgi:peptidoglycan biosynthesis protein MviN/MurJ (putative lipid II flippase)
MHTEESISKASFILIIAAILRYLFNFFIQPIIAYKFGATPPTDAYIIASMIPTLIGDYLISGLERIFYEHAKALTQRGLVCFF